MRKIHLAFALALSLTACASQPAAVETAAAAAPAAAGPKSFDAFPAPGTDAVCPVSGHAFKVKEDSLHSEYNGRVYVFCCPDCKPDFDANPAKFAAN